MGTRMERRKKLRQDRIRKYAYRSAACVAAGMIFFTGASLTTSGDFDTMPQPVEASAPAEITPCSVIEPIALVKAESKPAWTDTEVAAIAKTVYGEALITGSDEEMAAVAWCILNRVDSDIYPDDIIEVVTARKQFHGYNEKHPVDEHIEGLVRDVLSRWESEKRGEKNVGRVLPAEYLFFWGDGWHNHFTTEYQGGEEWDWSLPNPYKS